MTTTSITVQLIDEFLDSFNISDVSSTAKVDAVKEFTDATKGGVELTSGYFGAVYRNANYPNVVVKKQSLCSYPPPGSSVQQELCRLSQDGNLIFRIPNTLLNKTMILAPNYISENLIALNLYRLLSRYTPSFSSTSDFAIDTAANNVYTSMTLLDQIIPLITDEKQFFYMLFQVCQGLSVAQDLLKFTHYDLHSDNVLAKTHPAKKVNIYQLNNGQYFYTKENFDTIIVDFGLSRIETSKYIIRPTTTFIIPEDGLNKYMTEAEFNPYYDMISFFFFAFNAAYRKGRFGNFPNFNLDPANPRLFINVFKNMIVNMPDTVVSYDDLYNYIIRDNERGNFWRIKIESLNERYKMVTPSEMMTKLALMVKELFNLPSFNQPVTPANINAYLDTHKFLLLDNMLKVDDNTAIYPQISASDKQDLTFYQYRIFDDTADQIENGIYAYFTGSDELGKNDPTVDPGFDINQQIAFHRTVPNSMLTNTTTFQDQSITVINIDQSLVQQGYKFRFDCCNIDARNYFQNSSIISGVLINSTFFNITKTPIGYAESEGVIFNNPIPELFAPYYGCVVIDENGGIQITENINEGQKHLNVITVGPLLVYEGNIRFTRDMIRNERAANGQFLFQCGPRGSGVNVHSCNMNPGELYHAGNPNPRSALVIDINGNVTFVKVQGRDSKNVRGDFSVGMDLAQLAEFCLNRLDAVFAINLDGGQSSQIIWKKEGSDYITLSGGMDFAYPIGSVISFVKEK